ncbi:MAG TPA: YHS domain-containing protein [Capsulimonadaceae bacterium]|jgi:YHS domain-containing protein
MAQPLADAEIVNKYADPVCHKNVGPNAKFTSLYRGGVFYFCCKQCKREFDANPQLWVSVSHAEMSSANHGVL